MEEEYYNLNTCHQCVGSGIVEGFDGDVPCSRCSGDGYLPLTYVSDRIPLEVLKDEPYVTGQHIVPLKGLITSDIVPLTHRDKLCYSMGKDGHDEGSRTTGPTPICNGCGRPYSWFGYYCVLCGDFFIKDFSHPKFCFAYPTCWACMPRLPWAYCKSHGVSNDVRSEWGIVLPTGVNPKKYTEEDLKNVFEF